jgi:tryptophan-rich hypothetical protein
MSTPDPDPDPDPLPVAAHVADAPVGVSERPPRNRLSPKKLLLSKWTAVTPSDREKHFVVTRVIAPEPPATRIEQVELEAVHSRRARVLSWRELLDATRWRQGWL